MKRLLSDMEKRIADLRKGIMLAEKKAGTFPEGRLRVGGGKGNIKFYHMCESPEPSEKFIPKKNGELARILAQKEYTEKFLRLANHELQGLEKQARRLSKKNADMAYESATQVRRELIDPYILTDEVYAERWKSEKFRTNFYKWEERVYATKKGEQVRSKSEAIIADMLYELGIPYFYEKEVILKNGKVRYPDFTALRVRDRKVFYLEHFGLLDRPEYVEGCLKKLYEYMESGIYLGSNLLMTYETAETPLDIVQLRQMMKTVFL